MIKEFTVNIPDEPFTNNFSKGNTVTIRYNGPRYIVIEKNIKSGRLENEMFLANKLEDIESANLICKSTCEKFIVDASENPLVASLITNSYTYDEVDDYIEVLPTGEEYIVSFPTGAILSFYFNRMHIIVKDGVIDELEYVTPPVSDESFAETVKFQLSMYELEKLEAEEVGSPADILAKYDSMIKWLKTYKTKYKGVPAYKIPYPIFENL